MSDNRLSDAAKRPMSCPTQPMCRHHDKLRARRGSRPHDLIARIAKPDFPADVHPAHTKTGRCAQEKSPGFVDGNGGDIVRSRNILLFGMSSDGASRVVVTRLNNSHQTQPAVRPCNLQCVRYRGAGDFRSIKWNENLVEIRSAIRLCVTREKKRYVRSTHQADCDASETGSA